MSTSERADPLDCEVVTTSEGARAVRDRLTGELMHPVVGPAVEAERLYVTPARLRERLAEPHERPLVLLDVGLGAGSNALAAWKCSEARSGGRTLELISFDQSLAALALAAGDEHAGAFGFEGESLVAARALLERREHVSAHTHWRFVLGALPEALDALADASADVVFWDPFSPRANPSLWTMRAFAALRRVCRAGATVHTYSGATAARSAMVLAGFAVGMGAATGAHKRATIGAVDVRDLGAIGGEVTPLDARWLERLARSSAAFPADAPADAMERVRAAAQFGGEAGAS
jgi:queuine tRNA-ribosyltransferase